MSRCGQSSVLDYERKDDMNGKGKIFGIAGVVILLAMVAVLVTSIAMKSKKSTETAGDPGAPTAYEGEKSGYPTLEELSAQVTVKEATKKKGVVSFDNNNLYDELPEIDKYPLAVTGNGEVDIEILTSGEKAGKDNDSWLIDAANAFNGSGAALADGRSVSMSVRSVASGTAADYIISNKYVPDLYTPSNTLFGEYARTNGGEITGRVATTLNTTFRKRDLRSIYAST